jgi:hypothetical protein
LQILSGNRLAILERPLGLEGRPMRQRRKDHVLVNIGGGQLRAAGGYYYRVSGTTFGPEPAPVELDEAL